MDNTTITKGAVAAYTMTSTRNGWWFLRASQFWKRSYLSFSALAQTLGGVVAWDRLRFMHR